MRNPLLIKAEIFDLKQAYLNDMISTNQFCDDLNKLHNELNSQDNERNQTNPTAN